MDTVCTSCGQPLPTGARFCPSCGAPVATAEARPGPTEERRVVTVLFADIVGFTARSDRADPEDVRRTLLPFHTRVKEDIERFGGVLDKFIGDAAMGVFGAPVAHEDDPERAVRAALRILDTIASLNEQDPSLDISVRIGVNTGEAMVAFVSGPVVGENVAGDVVNTASRLQGVAPPGSVVIGEATLRATRGIFDVDALGLVTVKGKAEPLAVWLVRGSLAVGEEPATATPFVGRERELEMLVAAFDRAHASTSFELVTILGEPGIGKSRLLLELRERLSARADGAAWFQGGCLAYGEGIAFWPLRDIVRSIAAISNEDGSEAGERKLGAALERLEADADESEWLLARLAPLAGVGGDETAESVGREESFTAWSRFLELVATRGPLVLAFEDLHWADPALTSFVERLAERLAHLPVLVVCTARQELLARFEEWGGSRPNRSALDLARLTDEETDRLLLELLANAVLPDETRSALRSGAGGNPLYAQEFVRMLAEGGGDGAGAGLAAPGGIPVPDGVQAVIAARLDALPAAQRSLLQDAAAVGETFWSGAVSSMGGGSEDATLGELRELARKGFVVPARTSGVAGSKEFTFEHALIREVAYRQMPRGARARKHRAAGEWLETALHDRAAERPELLAFHFTEAIALARAAGEEPDGATVDRARRFLCLAGDRAMGVDVGEAAEDYLRALELTPAEHPDRPHVTLKAVRASRWSGRMTPAECETLLGEAAERLRASGDSRTAGEALVRRSLQLGLLGEGARATATLAEAIELLESQPPGEELAHAYAALSEHAELSGRQEESIGWADRALALLADDAAPEVRIMALQERGFARLELGDDAGVGDLRDALRVSSDLGLVTETAVSRMYLGEALWQLEGPEHGLGHHEEAIEFCRKRGLVSQAMWGTAESVWMLFDLGRWDDVLERAAEVSQWDRERGSGQTRAMAESYARRVLAHRGLVDEARRGLLQLVELARQHADLQVLAPALATAAIAEEDPALRIAFVEELEDSTRERGRSYREAHLPDIVETCLGAGRADLAARLLAGTEGRTPRQLLCVTTAAGSLAEATGDHEAGLELLDRASDGWNGYGAPFERARAELGAARCLLTLGRADEAAARLEPARRAFVDLGAAPWIDRADAVRAP